MKPKTVNTLYWTVTIIFALMMLADAYGGISRQEAGVEVMKHLGYPIYLLTIVGIAKFFGAIAILQTRFHTIKEWAYAGFAINFIGAFASRLFMGDSAGEIMGPVIGLLILFIPYFSWKKYEESKHRLV